MGHIFNGRYEIIPNVECSQFYLSKHLANTDLGADNTYILS